MSGSEGVAALSGGSATAVVYRSESEREESLGLEAGSEKAAIAADIVARDALEGETDTGKTEVSGKKTQSFLACILSPCTKLLIETIKPALISAINWIRNNVFGWICPATPKAPHIVPVQVKEGEELSPAQDAQRTLNGFLRVEGQRFDDRTNCKGASYRRLGTGTVRRPKGIQIQAVVNFDEKFVGGTTAAKNPEALADMLGAIDSKGVFKAFNALPNPKRDQEHVRTTILHHAAIAAGIEESGEEEWMLSVMENKESFAAQLGAIREGITAYFAAESADIDTTRATAEAAKAAEAAEAATEGGGGGGEAAGANEV